MKRKLRTHTLVRIIAGTAVVAVGVTLAGCAQEAAPKATSTSASAVPVPLVIADVPQQFDIEAAIDGGYFARHGLDVTVQNLASGSDNLAAVQGGSAQIGYADLFAGVNAINNGFDVDLVSAIDGQARRQPILVRADSAIKKPADLAGKSIGVLGVPQFTVFTRAWLSSNGVDPSTVTFTIIKQAAALPDALLGGSVDAIQDFGNRFVYQYADQVRQIGPSSTAKSADPKGAIAGFWANAGWAKKNKKTVSAFNQAIHEYVAWFVKQDVTDRAALFKKYLDVDYTTATNGDVNALTAIVDNRNALTGPIDITATLSLYKTAVKFAPELVPAGVNLKAHFFSTLEEKVAKQP